jgi:hypothetical protein
MSAFNGQVLKEGNNIMKLTRRQLKQIIQEELRSVLKEGVFTTLKGAFPPLNDAKKFVKRFATDREGRLRKDEIWPFLTALDRVKDEKVIKEIVMMKRDNFFIINLDAKWTGAAFTLPKSIGYFTDMRALSIQNHFFKTIPDSFKNLTNLIILDLSGNRIKKLPEWLGLLPLKALYVDGNKIEKLPKSLSGLQTLERVHITKNPIVNNPAFTAWETKFLPKRKWNAQGEQGIEFEIAEQLRRGTFPEELLEEPSLEAPNKPEFDTDEEAEGAELEDEGAEEAEEEEEQVPGRRYS